MHLGTEAHGGWESPSHPHDGPLRVGIGGPVGSGKTALVEQLCLQMRDKWSLAVITNDIFTREDALILTRAGALPSERIIGVETGGCPHTAIREDASMNFEAIDELRAHFPDLKIIFIESGGDNLAAAFSPELVDVFIYIIDVAQGEKIPRKGGPGIRQSDLLLINKTDLAPHVGASLQIMADDSRRMRGDLPFHFTNLRSGVGAAKIAHWLEHLLGGAAIGEAHRGIEWVQNPAASGADASFQSVNSPDSPALQRSEAGVSPALSAQL